MGDNMISSALKTMWLNELLEGQNLEYVNKNINSEHNIDFNNFYLVISGIPKNIYNRIYNIKAEEYVKLSNFINLKLTNLFENTNYKLEFFLNVYKLNKKLVFIISANKDVKIDISLVSKLIHKTVLNSYKEKINNFNENHMSLTVHSNNLKRWQDVKLEYEKIYQMSYYRFFLDDMSVLNEDEYIKISKDVPYINIAKLSNDLVEAVTKNKIENINEICDRLFIDLIKNSLNKNLCDETVSRVRFLILAYVSSDESYAIENKLKTIVFENYYCISNLNNDLKKSLVDISNEYFKNISRYIPVVSDAINYIHNNYYLDISLDLIAENVNLAPNYLSRLFNQNVGKSIPLFINEYRIEKAVNLLINSNLRISEISDKVGFTSLHRFGQIFKKIKNKTPKEYREEYKDIIK